MNELNFKETLKEWHGTYRSYAIGFIASLLLTFTSFALVHYQLISGHTLIIILIALALVQAFFQLRYFLHLGEEPKPRWETHIFFLMALLLIIIVIGSLWVMHDLEVRTMPNMEQMHD